MQIRKWDMAQLSFEGTQAGNPFVDVTVDALARCGGRTVEVMDFTTATAFTACASCRISAGAGR